LKKRAQKHRFSRETVFLKEFLNGRKRKDEMAEAEVNLVIRGKMLIDGRGGTPISSGLVAMAGKKVVYAGRAEEAPPFPPEAKRMDLPEACLLPGLIDMHVHPTYYWEEPDAGNYTYDPERTMVYSAASIALLAVARLTKALMAGVTTARDTGSAGDIMFDVKRAAQKKAFLSPKLAVAGRLIVPTAGHCNFLPDFSNEADGPYGFRQAVREELRNGADFIKIANNGQDLTQEELEAAVDEAHRHDKKVACHTGRPPAQRMAIDAGVDTFEHGSPTEEEIDLAVKRQITWDPTLNITLEYYKSLERDRNCSDPAIAELAEGEYARKAEYLDKKRESIAYAVKAGRRMVAGTDSWSCPTVRFDAIADEIRCLVEFGVPTDQAILGATAYAAQAMGWDEVGTLEQGKRADLIAVPGDPLADIGLMDRVLLVVQDGVIVKQGG
jgi:imidazolonepropionase-like amidohydrolase